MNRYIQNVLSLLLIILITILALNYYKIIQMDTLIHDGICFATLALIIIFSTASICSKGSNLNKFLGYLILVLIFTGLIMFIITGNINIILLSGIGFTALDALINMLYKNV